MQVIFITDKVNPSEMLTFCARKCITLEFDQVPTKTQWLKVVLEYVSFDKHSKENVFHRT